MAVAGFVAESVQVSSQYAKNVLLLRIAVNSNDDIPA